jgi:hypothetical protein
VLLQSLGFASPKDAGLAIAQLQDEAALTAMGRSYHLGSDVLETEVLQALAWLKSELADKAKSK